MSNRRRIPWARVLAEGLVIVVSILLAFGIDAWWTARQRDADLVELLEVLREDFRVARDDLTVAIRGDSASLVATETLLQASREQVRLPNDSIQVLAFPLVTGPSLTPTLPRYDAALASGRIAQLDGDTLLAALGMFDAARELHEGLWSIMRDRFNSGALDELRRDLGTLSILNPIGGRADPPERFIPDDLNDLIQTRRIYAIVEISFVNRVNLFNQLRIMDNAAAEVIDALDREIESR